MPTINISTGGGGGGVTLLRATYVVTESESISGTLDTTRTADQGTAINISGLTNAQFRDRVFVYRNGIVLFNDIDSIINISELQHDVARVTSDLKTLMFFGNLREGTIISLVVEDIV